MTMIMDKALLKVRDLRTVFHTRAGAVCAVDGVTFDVMPGECLGVVGESGSGKSVTFSSVMGLVRSPGVIENGSIHFEGRDIRKISTQEMRDLRGREIAMTMQDALTALNPSLTVGEQIAETVLAHDKTLPGGYFQRKKAIRERVIEILQLVGIASPEKRIKQYPHEFSGGMRQRLMIAIALSCRPKLLIADEPTTALDVTIQAQVLELIADIRSRLGMSVVLITHDLGVVSDYCDRVVVMYAGQIIETGPTRQLIENPQHPYTKGLLASLPKLSMRGQVIKPIQGQVPDLINLPPECRFYSRCTQRQAICRQIIETHTLSNDREVRCILATEGVN